MNSVAVGQVYKSLEDFQRFGRTRHLKVKAIVTQKRVNDKQPQPYAECESAIVNAGSRTDLAGKKRTVFVATARLLSRQYEIIEAPATVPNDTGVVAGC